MSSDITRNPSTSDETKSTETKSTEMKGDEMKNPSNSNMTVKIPTKENQEDPEINKKEKYPFIVSLEGNIGAGKSTIIDILRQKYKTEPDKYFGKLAKEKIVFMQEPVDVWTSVCDSVTGESILQKFYKDP